MKQHVASYFRGGEIAPTARGNVGLDIYQLSLVLGKNMLLTKDGTGFNRNGTAKVDKANIEYIGGDYAPLLYPFRSSDAAYVLEFSGHATNKVKVRVFSEDRELVTSFDMPASQTNYGQGNFVINDVLTSLDITSARDQIIVFSGEHAMVVINYTAGGTFSASWMELNGNPYLARDIDQQGNNTIASTGLPGATNSRVRFDTGGVFSGVTASAREAKSVNDVCTVDLSGSSFPCRQEWIGKHVRMTDGSEVVLAEITRIISGDRLMGVVKQSDNADNPWSVTALAFWSPVLGSTCTVTFGNTVSSVNSKDLGLTYMIDNGHGLVKVVNSSTSADLKIVKQGLVANAGAAVSGDTENVQNILLPQDIRVFARPAWGNNLEATYTGAVRTKWPALVTYFAGRIVCACSYAEPQGVWGSDTSFFSSFAPGPGENQAFQAEISAGENEVVTAVFGGPVLFVATRSSLMRASSRDGVISPPVTFRSELGYGFERVKPVQIGTYFAAVKSGHTGIIAVRYNDAYGVIEDFDMTAYASHIVSSLNDDTLEVKQLASSTANGTVLYALRSDGVLFSGNVAAGTANAAWTRFVFSDFDADGNETQAEVESMAVMKGFDGDQLWMCIRRTIGGVRVRFLEAVTPGRFLDCSLGVEDLDVTGTATGATISGLDHLEGQQVSVLWGDGHVPAKVVTSGDVALEFPYGASAVTVSATTGSITVTFPAGDASASLVGESIVLQNGGSIELTGYTNATTMTGTVRVALSGTSASKWFTYTPFLAGIYYEMEAIPHTEESRMNDGTTELRKRQVVRVGVRVIKTRKLKVRGYKDGVKTKDAPFQFFRSNTAIGGMTPEFTGAIETSNQSGFDTDGLIGIVSDGPWRAAFSLVKMEIDYQQGTASGAG